MSITREQLKVGETYIDNDGDIERTIIAIGEENVFYSYRSRKSNGDASVLVTQFLKENNIIKPEPKKLGEVAWFMDKVHGGLVFVRNEGTFFNEFSIDDNYQRVTLKDNEIWSYDE